MSFGEGQKLYMFLVVRGRAHKRPSAARAFWFSPGKFVRIEYELERVIEKQASPRPYWIFMRRATPNYTKIARQNFVTSRRYWPDWKRRRFIDSFGKKYSPKKGNSLSFCFPPKAERNTGLLFFWLSFSFRTHPQTFSNSIRMVLFVECCFRIIVKN